MNKKLDIQDNSEETRKSKSQIKREMHELQSIGERLTELSEKQLREISMPSELLEAVLFTKTLNKHGAIDRQKQLIGKLMREVDTEPIRSVLKEIDEGRQHDFLHFKQVEKWRDEITAGNEEIIDEIIKRFGNADSGKMKTLARNAGKEAKENKPPKSSRKLFKYLMEISKINLENKENE